MADAVDVTGPDAAEIARNRMLLVAQAVAKAFHVRAVDEPAADDVRHGRPIPPADVPGTYAVFDRDGRWLALVSERDGAARTVLGWMAG